MSIENSNPNNNPNTTSVKIFDKLWNNLRYNGKEYIYGKDLIILINNILDLAQIDVLQFKLPKFIKIEQIELINKFSNENDMIEIYKFTLNDILKNLINLTILEFINKCNVPELNALKFLNSSDNNMVNNQNSDQEKSNNKTKKRLQQIPDIIINSDDRKIDIETNAVNKNNKKRDENYKEKYKMLKSEYEYYRKNQEKIKSLKEIENNDQNNDMNNLINSKFLMDQFDKQLNEQTELINNLKLQIELRNELLKIDKKSGNNISDNNDNTIENTNEKLNGKFKNSFFETYTKQFFKLINNLIIFIIIMIFLTILYNICQKLINQDIFDTPNDKFTNIQLKWWEKNSVLNKLKYSIEDFYNEYKISNMLNDPDKENDTYNKIFGLE